MDIRVVSVFPEMITAGAGFGVVGRALRGGLISLAAHDPRDFAKDEHRSVDDRPYGGGPGMVMKYQPWHAAIAAAQDSLTSRCPVVFLGPEGRPFDQALARDFASLPGLTLVAGRYEGFDQRLVDTDADLQISLGDFVLSGGEIAALAIIDATARLVPGVLGDPASAASESFTEDLLDFPHYTRPASVGRQAVPDVLLSGDHEQIRRWRLKQSLGRTAELRPDLLARRELNEEERELLREFRRERSVHKATDVRQQPLLNS